MTFDIITCANGLGTLLTSSRAFVGPLIKVESGIQFSGSLFFFVKWFKIIRHDSVKTKEKNGCNHDNCLKKRGMIREYMGKRLMENNRVYL